MVAVDVWCPLPVWNLKVVIWFPFPISFLVVLPSSTPLALSVFIIFLLMCWAPVNMPDPFRRLSGSRPASQLSRPAGSWHRTGSYNIYVGSDFPHLRWFRIGCFFVCCVCVCAFFPAQKVALIITTRSEWHPFLYIWPGSDIDALSRIRLDWLRSPASSKTDQDSIRPFCSGTDGHRPADLNQIRFCTSGRVQISIRSVIQDPLGLNEVGSYQLLTKGPHPSFLISQVWIWVRPVFVHLAGFRYRYVIQDRIGLNEVGSDPLPVKWIGTMVTI